MEADTTFTRRVCAILLADVTGFSKLMGENDERTARAVHHLQSIAQGIVGEHNGRAEPVAGDALFATFDSVVAAVQAAVALQRRVASEPFEGQALRIRIGVHLGDVLTRDGRAFGDAINVAARLEALARPGTICISEGVHRQVRNTLDEPFVDLGRQKLKNISDPMHAYLIVPRGAAPLTAPRRLGMRSALMVVVLAAVGVAAVVAWRQFTPDEPAPPPKSEALSPASKKSVAVLPFVNMSSDKENEYFSDGITEDLIAALSKVSGLQVAARTSSFAFKGKNEDVRIIGERLNVGAVLEGSVAKAGNQVRITAQLINTADGFHLWSDTYDRELKDIFAIRSQVAQTVAQALQVTLDPGERQRLEQKPTENLEAYQLYLKGRYYVNRYTEDGLKKGLAYLEQAIALDAGYALAYQGLAKYYEVANDWFMAPKDAMPKSRAAAEKALQIDPKLSEPHASLAVVAWSFDWDWSAAEAQFRRALALDANGVAALELYAMYLAAVRSSPQGIAEATRAAEIDPLSPDANTFLGATLYWTHRDAEAIAELRATLEMEPSYSFARYWLGRAYVENGEVERGIAELRRAREGDPRNPDTMGTLGHAYAVAGDRDAAQGVIDELRRQAQASYVSPYLFAVIHAGLGETDTAFARLDEAYRDRSFFMPTMKSDSRLAALRADPRFTELLKKVGLEP